MAKQEQSTEISNSSHPAIVMNLFDPKLDSKLWGAANNFHGETGVAYVFGHGSPYSISDQSHGKGNALKLSPQDLARRLHERGATGDMRVVLDSCDTGKGQHSFARELSHYFLVVQAPTRTIWGNQTNHNSLIHDSTIAAIASKERMDDDDRPNHKDSGRWKNFYSGDYQHYKEHPQTDTPESELPGKSAIYSQGKWIDVEKDNDEPLTKPDTYAGLSPYVTADEFKRQQENFKENRSEMATAYEAAAKTNNPNDWADAIENYPLMAIALKFRTALYDATTQKNPETQAGIDSYAANMILKGKVRELVDQIPQSQQVLEP